MVDKQLGQLAEKATDDAQKQRINALMGKAAIANAKLAYESFKRIFSSERFAAAEGKRRKGAASTVGVHQHQESGLSRHHVYRTLIGADTVNTVPPQTMDAFRDHGIAKPTLEAGLDEAHHVFDELKAVGIDMKAVTDQADRRGRGLFFGIVRRADRSDRSASRRSDALPSSRVTARRSASTRTISKAPSRTSTRRRLSPAFGRRTPRCGRAILSTRRSSATRWAG